MKTCLKCKVAKKKEEFHRDKLREDGLCPYCKSCVKVYRRRYYLENRERIIKENGEYNRRHKEARKIYVKRDQKKNADAARARRKLHYALRSGKIEKPSKCSDCGVGKRKRLIHGHHPDYNKPLDVLWLCAACHFKEHRRLSLEKEKNGN